MSFVSASLLLILAFVACPCFSQVANYQIVYSYPVGSIDCSGAYNGIVVTNSSGGCFALNCSCQANVGCVKVVCGATSVPANPPNAIAVGQYVDNSCTGVVSFYTALTSGVCLATNAALSRSSILSCTGSTFNQFDYGNGNCTGTPIASLSLPTGSSSVCRSVINEPGSFYYACGVVCFHKDSQIKYNGQEFSYAALSAEKNPACVIPHTVNTDGVKISTTCAGVLRLTHGHLVMTNHGWKKAGLVGAGDKLYSQVHSHDNECEVTKVETESNQEYFGLNCEESHVLSNGYWVSTFGETHAIPSAWMKVMSKFIGIRAASHIGDKIATFTHSWSYLFN